MGRIEKILSFEGLQELHSGFGYASASIPFLQAFKGSEIFTTFVKTKTNLYTQKGILPAAYSNNAFIVFIGKTLNPQESSYYKLQSR